MKSVVKSNQVPAPGLRSAALCALLTLGLCSVALGWGRKPPIEPAAGGDSAVLPRGHYADALKDSFPDAVSYPAVGFGDEIKGEEAKALTSLVASSSDYVGDTRTIAVTRRWWECKPHHLVSAVLPKVRFYRLTENDYRMMDGSELSRIVAVSGNRIYSTDALNRFLLEAGFTFDSTEMPSIAKVAVLLATLGKWPPDTNPYLRGEAQRPAPGFPAITFLSVKRDTWRPKGSSVWDGVWVDCILDQRRVKVFVSFWGADKWGRRQPERVFGGGMNLMPGPVRLPRSAHLGE